MQAQALSRSSLVEAFREAFGGAPDVVVRAPGRVNLIGEHTDYNDGFVMPIAIDRRLWIAARKRTDRRVDVRSKETGDAVCLSLDDPARRGDLGAGMAAVLGETRPFLAGFDGVILSDVPIGAGLSSSAAMEMALARVFALVSGFVWEAVTMARAGQRVENEWLGVSCGIMDPLISAGGRAGHAMLIDCRSLEMRPVPLPEGASVVVLDTSTRRKLAGSEYNDRRAQCAAAA
ncbi:MAG: galactokinase family protein, partial [Vicinamibacteria bacterium]